MKTYTKHGFLYYELTVQQNKPAVIISSDKENRVEIFRDTDLRTQFVDSLKEEMKKAGAELFQIPETAVWFNPSTLLSVRALQDKFIILEFPWKVTKQIEFSSVASLKTAYKSIQDSLDSAGGPGDLSAYLLKSEAAETYLKKEAAQGFAEQADVDAVTARVTDLEGEVTGMAQDVANATSAAEAAQQDVDTLEGAVSALSTTVSDNKTAVDAEISGINGKLDVDKEDINILKQKTTQLNTDGTVTNLTVTGAAAFASAPTSASDSSFSDLSNAALPNKTQVTSAIATYTPKVYNNVLLTSSEVVAGDSNYPYLNTFTINGIDNSYIPTVILSSAQVVSGEWASTAETISDAVTIRTKSQVAAGTTIPQVICQKSE